MGEAQYGFKIHVRVGFTPTPLARYLSLASNCAISILASDAHTTLYYCSWEGAGVNPALTYTGWIAGVWF